MTELEAKEKRIEELTEWLKEASDGKLKLQMLRADLVSKIGNQKKRIAELEEKISILLSCKNCPENKGGYICQKEYEDKCLAQKIEYIKELQEENAELKTQAKKIILKLYNVGRDVLMCRADEAAYDNLSTVINDRSIEQFLKECE